MCFTIYWFWFPAWYNIASTNAKSNYFNRKVVNTFSEVFVRQILRDSSTRARVTQLCKLSTADQAKLKTYKKLITIFMIKGEIGYSSLRRIKIYCGNVLAFQIDFVYDFLSEVIVYKRSVSL